MNSETNRIEYKQQLSSDLEIEAIAFLNYHEGGVIYIGIDKTGSVIGVPDIDGDMLKIIEMTLPDKPNSSLQKYRLTTLGKQLKEQL